MKDSRFKKFNLLYEKHAVGLLLYASKFVGSQLSEDIVQDVFLRIWENNYIDFDALEIKRYLFTAVKNACFDHLRRDKKRNKNVSQADLEIRLMEIFYEEDPLDSLLLKEQKRSVDVSIEELPEACKKIFKDFYIADKSQLEIAEKYAISIRTVENQVYKGLKLLKDKLKVNRS